MNAKQITPEQVDAWFKDYCVRLDSSHELGTNKAFQSGVAVSMLHTFISDPAFARRMYLKDVKAHARKNGVVK